MYICFKGYYIAHSQPPTQGPPGVGRNCSSHKCLVPFNNLAPRGGGTIPPAHLFTSRKYEVNKEFICCVLLFREWDYDGW